jgi:hypothetical protein
MPPGRNETPPREGVAIYGKKEGVMPKQTVVVKFDKVGKQIECQPHRAYAEVADDVEWVIAGGYPFAVNFGLDSPFPEISYSSAKGGSVSAKVKASAAEELYEYFIAIYFPDDNKIYTLDPDIIIRGKA